MESAKLRKAASAKKLPNWCNKKLKLQKKLNLNIDRGSTKDQVLKELKEFSQKCKIERKGYRISQEKYLIVQADSDKKEFCDIIKSTSEFQWNTNYN